ncbi:hypothetical protein QUF80_14240 [Desulfococcaceae bacterium HSG8]|nr:hypothetical protein [Desulfococcaceae bacterium HSG8]
MIFSLCKTISHYFPDLFDKISKLEDCRKRKHYELAELVMACVFMFIFKKGSRNAFNNERSEEEFRTNYEKIFKVHLPHMDTVDEVMRISDERQSEKLKKEMTGVLTERKIFHKYRLLGKYFRVVIDGTHVMNVNEGHCNRCLHKTSEHGKTTYFLKCCPKF